MLYNNFHTSFLLDYFLIMVLLLILQIFDIYMTTNFVNATQILPKNIVKNTVTIFAQKTGNLGADYFYCQNGEKCSTEQVVREFYKNQGYKVMRAEHDFWQGMFVLTFLDELYPAQFYKSDGKHAYYTDVDFFKHRYDNLILENKIKNDTVIYDFLNAQLQKHENDLYIRELDGWEIEGYKNPTEYFKSAIVQEFLKRVDNSTFCLVINRILQDKKNNMIGTRDYIIWNKNEMIFVEVKRKNEKLSDAQIQWGEFLIKNNVLYKVVRVVGK